MASSLVLRRLAASSSLFSKLTNPVRPALVAPSITRSFNTNAQMKRFEGDESDVELDRRSDSRRDSGLFSDVWDPFSPTRSLSQILNQMDQFMENPFFTMPRGMGGASRRPWDAKEDSNGLYIRMDMPGLGKEHVKLSIEQNTLVIKGQGEKESEDEESWGRYSSRIDLPAHTYKLGEIKAEMKNGVLKVTVPKVKEEERKDVFQVNVE